MELLHKSISHALSLHERSYLTFNNFPDASSGGTADWAKGVAGIRYTYAVELRAERYGGLNYAGFILPPTSIQPQGEEMWAGLRAMVREIYAQAGPQQPANIQVTDEK